MYRKFSKSRLCLRALNKNSNHFCSMNFTKSEIYPSSFIRFIYLSLIYKNNIEYDLC